MLILMGVSHGPKPSTGIRIWYTLSKAQGRDPRGQPQSELESAYRRSPSDFKKYLQAPPWLRFPQQQRFRDDHGSSSVRVQWLAGAISHDDDAELDAAYLRFFIHLATSRTYIEAISDPGFEKLRSHDRSGCGCLPALLLATDECVKIRFPGAIGVPGCPSTVPWL
jgi:hypothetical protein